MAVTRVQADQAHTAASQLLIASQALLVYTNRVSGLFDSNFTIKVGDENVTLDQATQDRLIDIAKYQTLKANLVTAFNLLP